MGIFGPKKLIDDDEWEWQLACFQWLLANTGGIEEFRKYLLIKPTREFFPSTYADKPNQAELLFNIIKTHAAMTDWPVTLRKGESNKPNSLHPGTNFVHDKTPALGTFETVKNTSGMHDVIISYNPDLLKNIESFVATMAHELSHYLLHSFNTLPPGGHDMEEYTTDLCAVFLGFGLFIANNAKITGGFTDFDQQGWQVGYAGYLSEPALITALSITETLAGRDPMMAQNYLKPYLAKDLKKANKYIAKRDILDDIMAVDLAEYGDYKNLA